jgi:hypothetical protein
MNGIQLGLLLGSWALFGVLANFKIVTQPIPAGRFAFLVLTGAVLGFLMLGPLMYFSYFYNPEKQVFYKLFVCSEEDFNKYENNLIDYESAVEAQDAYAKKVLK